MKKKCTRQDSARGQSSIVRTSIIVPTYEEADNLHKLVYDLHDVLKENFEITIVDDNSPDGTAEVAEKLSKTYKNINVIRRPFKMGIGSAIKEGFKVSKGDFIVQMDADFSHSPHDLPKLLHEAEHADVVLGSRRVAGGRIIGWNLHRNMVHLGANVLSRMILQLGVRDATSGFKVYRRDAFLALASMSNFNSFADFDQECLCIAKKLKLRVVEAPITFVDRIEGKSKLDLMDIISFVKAILKLKIHSLKS